MILDNNKQIYLKRGNNYPLITYYLTDNVLKHNQISKDMLNNIAVTFSMINIENGNYIIANEQADFIVDEEISTLNSDKKYCLTYQLNSDDTNIVGRYYGEFILDFFGQYNHKISLPNNNKIMINITDSITNTTVI